MPNTKTKIKSYFGTDIVPLDFDKQKRKDNNTAYLKQRIKESHTPNSN